MRPPLVSERHRPPTIGIGLAIAVAMDATVVRHPGRERGARGHRRDSGEAVARMTYDVL
jgi:hypothetical protein